MSDQIEQALENEEVTLSVEEQAEEVKAEEVEAVEAVVAPAEETAEVEATAEEKADDLDIVKKAVEEVAGENAELKSAVEAAEAKAAELADELKAKADKLEELEAKASAPMINVKTIKDPSMDSKAQFKTFLSEGVEGLKTKGSDLQISVDAQGGYAVPEELRSEIIRLEREISPLRQVCSVASASTSDVKQLVGIGAAASGWVGETDARAQTNTPDLAQRTAVFGEVYARPRVYQHMLEDAFYNVEAWLTQEVARQFAEAEGTAFLSGDGSNKPVGILNGLTLSANSAANDATGAYEVLNSGADGALGASDSATIDFLRSVVVSCKTGYLPNAKWMMNRATHNVLAGLKDGNGVPFINRNIAEAAAEKLFGFDIIINDDMDDIPAGTGDAAPIIFGDFSRGFQIVDRVGVSMLRDPYTNPGSVMFYTRKRVGSMVLDASALKVAAVSKA